jgi:hypothetical protein
LTDEYSCSWSEEKTFENVFREPGWLQVVVVPGVLQQVEATPLLQFPEAQPVLQVQLRFSESVLLKNLFRETAEFFKMYVY